MPQPSSCPICGSEVVKEGFRYCCENEECPLIYYKRRGKTAIDPFIMEEWKRRNPQAIAKILPEI